MRRLLHTPFMLLVRRMALLYAVLMLCRAAFWLYNSAQLGLPAWSEAGALLRGALQFDTASAVYADGVFILLSLLPIPVAWYGRRWVRNALFGCYVAVNGLLVVAANLADAIYFHYAQKRITADEILFAGNDNSLPLILKFAAENWYMVLLAAGLIWLLVRGYGRRIRPEALLRPAWSYPLRCLLLAATAGLCIGGMRGGFTRMTRPITLSNATLYTTDNAWANLILSNPFCILRTAGSAGKAEQLHYFTPDRLQQLFTPRHEPADSAVVLLPGRNVMLFIMESMSAEHSARLRPDLYADRTTKGFTPFLDSLMEQGICFERMYANGTRSIQAMPSVLGSIPSFKTPFVLMPQALGESRQLPAILAAQGYSTAFFCGSERGSMGFGAYARSAGIERLLSREDYEARYGAGDFDGYWGIWDEPFIRFAGETVAEMPEPFFATLFTLTAHHPFVVPDGERASLPEGYTPVHPGAAYDDRAVRRLFERFGNEEWFRRTIFVFVADHVSSEKFAPESREFPGDRHIIGFIYTPEGVTPDGSGLVVRETVQQLDIMPTLLGILGNREPYFAFGRDVLNEPDRPRWSVSYDSGAFRAVTDEGVLHFDEQQPADTTAGSLVQTYQALVQSYYDCIASKRYLP